MSEVILCRQPKIMTVTQFFEAAKGDDGRYELIDGEIVALSVCDPSKKDDVSPQTYMTASLSFV